MPSQLIRDTVILVGTISNQPTNSIHVFDKESKDYQKVYETFLPSDPAFGKLCEGSLYFDVFSPVPPPNTRAGSTHPGDLASRIFEELPWQLDTLIGVVAEFEEEYGFATSNLLGQTLEDAETAFGESLSFSLNNSSGSSEIEALVAKFQAESKVAANQLKESISPTSVTRKLMKLHLLNEALRIAEDFWAEKLKWDRGSLAESLPRRLRWLYTLSTRKNEMEAGDKPTKVSIGDFQATLKSIVEDTLEGNPFCKSKRSDPEGIQRKIDEMKTQALNWLRANKQFTGAELPSSIGVMIESFVHAAAGNERIDELYLLKSIHWSITELAAAVRQDSKKRAEAGAAMGQQWYREHPGGDILTSPETSSIADEIAEKVFDDPLAEQERRVASVAVLAIRGSEEKDRTHLLQSMMLPSGLKRTELDTFVHDESTNERLLTYAIQPHALLPAPANQNQGGDSFALSVNGDHRTDLAAYQNAKEFSQSPRGDISVWCNKGAQLAVPIASRPRTPGATAQLTPDARRSQQAMRILVYSLLMLHEDVDFTQPDSQSLAILMEYLRYDSFEEMLKEKPLSMFVSVTDIKAVRTQYQDAESGLMTHLVPLRKRLSHFYGIRELMRSCRLKSNLGRILIFDGTAQDFLDFWAELNDQAQFPSQRDFAFNGWTVDTCKIPSVVYFTDLGFDSLDQKKQFVQSLKTYLQPTHKPLPHVILDAGPAWWGKKGSSVAPWQELEPVLDIPNAHYVGPGLRYRGANDGTGDTPLLPSGYALLSAYLCGEEWPYHRTGKHTLPVCGECKIRYFYSHQDNDQIGAGLIKSITQGLIGLKSRKAMIADIANWFAIVRLRGGDVDVGSLTVLTRENWPFGCPMPTWCSPDFDGCNLLFDYRPSLKSYKPVVKLTNGQTEKQKSEAVGHVGITRKSPPAGKDDTNWIG